MKKKKNKIIIYLILFFLIGTLSLSIYKILSWKKDNDKIDSQIKEIEEITEIKEIADNEKTEIINPPEKKKTHTGTTLS